MNSHRFNKKVLFKIVLFFSFFFHLGLALAIPPAVMQGPLPIGYVAHHVQQSFGALIHFITAGSYIAGIGFFVMAISKFKQHKDNPTQVSIGNALVMTTVAAALLYFPTVLGVTGMSLFGTAAHTAGPAGVII